jgi:hypothetical protein
VTPQKKNPLELAFEELQRRAEEATAQIYEDWNKLGRVRPVAVTWVGGTVLDDRGVPIEDTVVCLLPEDQARQQKVLKGMVARTKAAAVLVIRQNGSDITAVFETPIGSTSWHYKVEDRADRKVVVRSCVKRNAECLGLLRNNN